MISGRTSKSLEACVHLLLRGTAEQPLQIEVVIDTGFSGSLTLPPTVIQSLGLPWLCRQQGQLADGRVHPFDVYVATLIWDEAERVVEVEAANVHPLLGTSLLAGYRLTIEMRPGGQVILDPLAE